MRRTILSRPYLLASGAFLLAATAALAGSGVGGVFNLGQTNSVNGTTRLQGATSSQQLYVQNASATADSIGIIGVSTAGTGVWGHTNSRVGVRASTRSMPASSSMDSIDCWRSKRSSSVIKSLGQNR